jgi:hypothetical protein
MVGEVRADEAGPTGDKECVLDGHVDERKETLCKRRGCSPLFLLESFSRVTHFVRRAISGQH